MKIFKKNVCILLILVISVSVCSCGYNLFGTDTDRYAVALSGEKREIGYDDYTSNEYKSFNLKLQDFSARLSELLYKEFGKEPENAAFSPVSVYMALALAAECSDGQTREEILEALDMSYEEISEFTGILYALSNEEHYYYPEYSQKKAVSAFSELNNSIWLDGDVRINKKNALAFAENFNADIFDVDFESGEANKVIKQYIDEKTRGLIDGDIEMSTETVFVILSTLYLKEIWLEMGKELEKTDEKYEFKSAVGNRKSVNLLESKYISGNAYIGENYKSFYAQTKHGYKLHFILPDEGVSVGDVFTSDIIKNVLAINDYGGTDDINKESHKTRVIFPAFDADFDDDINTVLREDLGISRMFSPKDADFSALSHNSGFNLFCNKVVHKTAVRVDEAGIEGAAITAVSLDNSAPPPPPYKTIYHDLLIDRSFGFILTDYNGTPLFSGVINEIN